MRVFTRVSAWQPGQMALAYGGVVFDAEAVYGKGH